MKVLIVDDEAVVRVGLKSIIDWRALGHEVVGEAENGAQALDVAARTLPDVVITDIRMPVMDGIELISRLASRPDPPAFLVLSSYSDFVLVKEAMKRGASDYLLKLEMTAESLAAALEVVSEKRPGRKGGAEAGARPGPVERRPLEEMVFDPHAPESEVAEALRHCLGEESLTLHCLALRVGETYRLENMSADELFTLNRSIVGFAGDALSGRARGVCFPVRTGEFCVLVSGAASVETVRDAAAQLAGALASYTNLTSHFGVSSGGMTADGFRAAYRRATYALSFRFFRPAGDVILADALPAAAPQPQGRVSIPRSALLAALLRRDRQAVASLFGALRQEIASPGLDADTVRAAALEAYLVVLEFLQMRQETGTSPLGAGLGALEEVVRLDSLKGVARWLDRLEEGLAEHLAADRCTDPQQLVGFAVEYMRDNYRHDISLGEVADRVGLSHSYFSTVFRIHTGSGFTEMLTSLRVEEGRRLLESTDMKIYEISRAVGYGDDFYFNRVFKKTTGMTPLEYRRAHKVG